MAAYEVALGPIVQRFVLGANIELRKMLAESLRTELHNGPNSAAAFTFNVDGVNYDALPLSCRGLVAVYRPMSHEELSRLRREQGRRVERTGYYVVDLLPPGSAIYVRAPYGM